VVGTLRKGGGFLAPLWCTHLRLYVGVSRDNNDMYVIHMFLSRLFCHTPKTSFYVFVAAERSSTPKTSFYVFVAADLYATSSGATVKNMFLSRLLFLDDRWFTVSLLLSFETSVFLQPSPD